MPRNKSTFVIYWLYTLKMWLIVLRECGWWVWYWEIVGCGNDMSIILRMIWEREWYEDDIGYWMIMENIEKWWVCGNDLRRAGAHWLRNWLTRAHLNKHEGLGCLGAARARCWGSHPLLKHGFRWNTKVAYLMWWTCAKAISLRSQT